MNRAQAARLDLINNHGETNPIVLNEAMREQITVKTSGTRDDRSKLAAQDHPAMEIIRQNDAVIGDYELLYRKAYFMATGVPTSGEMVVLDALGIPMNPEDLYAKGLKPRNFEECVKILLQLRQEIDKRAGVGNGAITLEKTETTQKITLPVEQLMALRDQLLKVRKETGKGMAESGGDGGES